MPFDIHFDLDGMSLCWPALPGWDHCCWRHSDPSPGTHPTGSPPVAIGDDEYERNIALVAILTVGL